VSDLSGDFYELDIAMHGPGWFSMQYSGSKSSKLSLAANVTSDIYVSKGATSDPNNFVYDMKFTGMSGNVTLNADDLGLTSSTGYSVAVYCNAINETANEVHYGKLSLVFAEGGATMIKVAATVLAATVTSLLV